MQELEEILNTVDNDKRLKALVKYARALNIDVERARDEEGRLSENRLIILIYDVGREQKYRKDESVGILIGGFFLLVALGFVLWVINKILK